MEVLIHPGHPGQKKKKKRVELGQLDKESPLLFRLSSKRLLQCGYDDELKRPLGLEANMKISRTRPVARTKVFLPVDESSYSRETCCI